MRILAIETSCDETAIALVEFKKSRFKILLNIVASQVKVHRKWGGVVPTLAKREHQKNLVPVLERALKGAGLLSEERKTQSEKQDLKFKKLKEILIREEFLYKKLKNFLIKYQKPKVNLIAVTVGPGLEPALWVGVNFAKALAFFWKLPIIPVNHIEGHIFANFLDRKFNPKDKSLFPLICLSVAGGHTQLILMKDYGKYKLLGETRDDTAGECFDKVARMLNLGYPGGPAIAQKASKSDTGQTYVRLPRPMIYQKNYDFSFSGLKTAVLYLVKQLTINNQQLTINQKRAICAETQQAIIDVLIKKTIKVAQDSRVKSIILSGGVAANYELRRQLKGAVEEKLPNSKFLMPDLQFCTDNGAMIGAAAYFYWQIGQRKNWQKIKANANLRI